MMEFAQKKNVKVISLAIAALMVIGVFVLAIQGRNLGGGDATMNSAIGKVNYNQVMASAPGLADAQTQLQQAAEDSRKEFEEKSKDMSDADKQKLAQEYQKKLQDKQKEVLEPVKKEVDDAIVAVGKTKGLTVVVNQGAVVYGGVDVTTDVQAQLKKAKK
ncbi:OmpH family outer membrane protein [Acidaminococcus timonensis]|uniref:OmpH family outer membrane protein n=1 Tax=Acidaminococcus timonensis TaxID=1871002 RepID=UPI00248ACDC3|nr:OmpH family outer membrane protein [Acidaminococcus timonensis]